MGDPSRPTPQALRRPFLNTYYEITRRAELADRPDAAFWSLGEFTGAVRTPLSEERRDLLLAYDDERVAGLGVLFRGVTANLDKARLMVDVDPRDQRRGIGRALLAALEGIAGSDDRTVLTASVTVPPTDPLGHHFVRFAEACGYAVAQVELIRHLALPVAEATLTGWVAPGGPGGTGGSGYELLTLVDEMPEDLRASWGRLHAQLMVDAPSGGVDYEEDQLSSAQQDERLAMVHAMGRSVYETIAVTADRQVVAQSTLAVPIDPAAVGDAYQWGTFVDRDHRGRGLGLAVKAANLAAVQRDRPGLSRVITQNAETNRHMVAINERLGFVAVEHVVDLVKRVASG